MSLLCLFFQSYDNFDCRYSSFYNKWVKSGFSFFFFFQAKADLVTTSTDVPEQNSPAVSQIKDRRE